MGDAGRERLLGGTDEMNGFEVSNVDDLDFVGPRRFGGELARETEFSPEMREGVRGVFASERERCLLGVFGALYIVRGKVKVMNTT